MRKSLIVLFMLLISMVGMAKNSYYEGNIGKYPIVVAVSEQGELLYYYYKSNPKSHFKLVVESEKECTPSEYQTIWDGIIPDGCFKMTVREVTPNGNVSGRFYLTFAGRWHMEYIIYVYEGTFVRNKDGQKFKVEFGGSFEMVE